MFGSEGNKIRVVRKELGGYRRKGLGEKSPNKAMKLLRKAGYSEKAIDYYMRKANVGVIEGAEAVDSYTGFCGDSMRVYFAVINSAQELNLTLAAVDLSKIGLPKWKGGNGTHGYSSHLAFLGKP